MSKTGKQFTVILTTEEHPACFEKACKEEHLVKYLVVKTKKATNYFQEGHYIYKALFRFAEEYPGTFQDMRTVKIEAMSGVEKLTIQRMFTELEHKQLHQQV